MAAVDLEDLLDLYRTPAINEDPAIESQTLLKKIIAGAGTRFPVIRTRGFLTHIAIPEKDGDIHFYIETRESAEEPDRPMMACEIQGIYRNGKKTEDPRMKPFRQLFGKEVFVEGLLRAWPEHLRDSTQPHLFELHPVLRISELGKSPLRFLDRVVWPTGEDPEEKARSFNAVLNPPKGLSIPLKNGRIVFVHPKKSFKKENYVHVEGYYRADGKATSVGFAFPLYETISGSRYAQCIALKDTPCFAKVASMKQGHYRVGGLCGFELGNLVLSKPAWTVQACPVLDVKKLP